jgi:hypothetical protein
MSWLRMIAVVLLVVGIAPLVPSSDLPGRERYRFTPSPLDRFMQPNPPARPLLQREYPGAFDEEVDSPPREHARKGGGRFHLLRKERPQPPLLARASIGWGRTRKIHPTPISFQ